MNTNNIYAPIPKAEKMDSLNLRITPKLKSEFSALCESRGTTVAQVLRNFMETQLVDHTPAVSSEQ